MYLIKINSTHKLVKCTYTNSYNGGGVGSGKSKKAKTSIRLPLQMDNLCIQYSRFGSLGYRSQNYSNIFCAIKF